MQSEVAVKRPHGEYALEVMSRWTVRDLVEQTDEQLKLADEKYEKFSGQLNVIGSGEQNLIRYWMVESSSGKVYQVRRFENFVFCSCPDFFKNRHMCKHLSVTIKHFCKRCRAALAREDGLCWGCHTDCFPYGKTAAVTQQENKNA